MLGDEPVRIGVSACLLGQEVRYDGRDKAASFPLHHLDARVQWVPVCPEVEIGLGVPREPIELVATGGDVRLLGVRSRDDHTEPMRTWSGRRLAALERAGVDGYVLKAGSPSCGLDGVPVHDPNDGEPVAERPGLFAEELRTQLPDLPVEEESRLRDPVRRQDFLGRVGVRHRWRALRAKHVAPRDLVDLHTREKMTILAHDPGRYRELGRLVADAGAPGLPARCDRYGDLLAAAMSQPSTRGRHVNVLEHLVGMLEEVLTADERRALSGGLAAYAAGERDRVDLVAQLRDAAQRGGAPDWVRVQSYLAEDPLIGR